MSANSSIEYVVICVDNSDYMRNEDIRPNRFLSEKDTVNIISHHILSARPENKVSMVTLGNTPQVIQSLTNNEINLMRKLYAIEMNGEINLKDAIKVSILSLKQISLKGFVSTNKKQTIILLIGSPIKEDIKQLESLVHNLNKLKISVNIICFGSENQNNANILNKFVAKLKDWHLLNVPNNRIMTNVLAESEILSNSRRVRLVNENMDPELALAMKLSIDEHKNQLDADMKKALESSIHSSNTKAIPWDSNDSNDSNDDIQKAIQMSLNFKDTSNSKILQSKTEEMTKNEPKRMTEEEQLALTLQMSLLQSQINSKKSSQQSKEPKKSNQKRNKTNGKTNGKKWQNNHKKN